MPKKMPGKKKKNAKIVPEHLHSPILQPDKREAKSNIACPDDENVERAKKWVDRNEL
ncbi:MAG: DUF3787 domain-containing protein [Oscillospiraceae bacterium]|nr:DUF3787 domain-containing protein [Oscillospiraceae bacterium]